MNKSIQELFQSIGNQILDLVGDDKHQVLAYAEAEDSAVSVSLFYNQSNQDMPVFQFGGRTLSDQFYSLWNLWGEDNNGLQWHAATYFIDNGKPTLEVIYSDAFDQNAGENVRRLAVVTKYFGKSKIDYSQV